FLAFHVDDKGMVKMVAGERSNPIRAEELVFIEHPRKYPAKPLLVLKRHNAAFPHAEMTRSGCMEAIFELGHAPDALAKCRKYAWHQFALPRLDDRRGAYRQQSHHGAHFQPRCRAIGKAQDIIIESILFVPHPARD